MARENASSRSYIRRQLDSELAELLSLVPAIAIRGPRGVGKTTTALKFAKTVFRLDNETELTSVLANPDQLVDAPEPILIREWQRHPASWDLVRRSVDADYRPGRFILTSSSAPINPPAHTGAGRIITVRMRPMSLAERWAGVLEPTVSLTALLNADPSESPPEISGTTEVVADDYINEIVSSGFPALRSQRTQSASDDGSLAAARKRLQSYCDLIVDADFANAGYKVRNAPALRRWMKAYAAASSTAASYETIRAAASSKDKTPARSTTIPYNDILKSMWVVEPLLAWVPFANQINRLTQAPKHHLADPALAARLLGASASALKSGGRTGAAKLWDDGLAGRLFGSLVALNLRVYAQAAEAEVYHLRTKEGVREIDFIVERDDGAVVAIEAMYKQVPSEDDFRHLNWLKEKIGDELVDAVMITTGPYAYRRLQQDGIAVVPAALLGP